MFKQDWTEKQIEAIGDTLAVAIFGKKKLKDILEDYDENHEKDEIDGLEEKTLRVTINKFLDNDDINRAENILFSSIKRNPSVGKLLIAFDFYNKINEWSNEDLEKNNFSREEIKDGIENIKRVYDKI